MTSRDHTELGVPNLRDLGGLEVRDGRRLRPRRLLRGASVAGASANAVRRLRTLGVTDVVDLRADWELTEAGCVPSGFRVHRIDLVPDHERERSHHLLRSGGLPAYYGWVLRAAAGRLARIVDVVAAASGGVLVQCGAGKDRTGIAIAVLLDLLGADDAVIARDYARTAEALPTLRARLRRTPGYHRAVTSLPREAMLAPPEALLAELHGLRLDAGSVQAHLAGAGLDTATVTRLRARLLVPQG